MTAREEALLVLETFRSGWQDLDFDRIVGTFCRTGVVTVYGTDQGEDWLSREELEGPFRAMTRGYRRARYEWGPGDPIVVTAGGRPWAYGMLSGSVEVGRRRHDFKMRTSFIFRREGGQLRICHAHCSTGLVASAAPYGADH